MKAKQLWWLGGALAIVAILALGWNLLISPMLSTINQNEELTATVEAQNSVFQAELDSLAAIDPAELEQQLAASTAQVPTGIDEGDIIDWISAAAKASGVAVTGVQFGAAQAVAASSDTASDTSGDATGTTGTTDAAADPIAAAAAEGLVTVPIVVSYGGDARAAGVFVQALQTASRVFLVSTVTIGQSEEGSSGSLSANVFVLP